jgi:hemoglobin
MNDISSRDDIELLVNSFYKKVVDDPVIAHFFTDAVQLSWENHIPIMISFWETLLLDEITYRGNPMEKHIALNRIAPLRREHFQRWIRLWEETVRENFSGIKANEAITRAQSIAQIMEGRLGMNSTIES